jgi:hypothetical protein
MLRCLIKHKDNYSFTYPPNRHIHIPIQPTDGDYISPPTSARIPVLLERAEVNGITDVTAVRRNTRKVMDSFRSRNEILYTRTILIIDQR